MCVRACTDLGGVVLQSPLKAINRFEIDAGVAPGSIFAAAAKKGNGGAFPRLERGEVTLEEFFPLFGSELADSGLVLKKDVSGMCCCSVLQHVAVCCSVLQYVAVCCCVLQCVAVCCDVSPRDIAPDVRQVCVVAVCCSMLQCVAVTKDVSGRHSQQSVPCSM